jgi:hypothetical protein
MADVHGGDRPVESQALNFARVERTVGGWGSSQYQYAYNDPNL